ncbi:MAG: MBL fold metallo-hydrolase [Chloroflexota bacterium]
MDWRTELGGGVRVALVQAGTFHSDAGTIFGPVPRFMWERLVADELTADNSLIQALNCLLIETPGGRVLVETGIGERLDEAHRTMRGVEGLAILPSLRAAGRTCSVDAVALSHLHFDHAGGLLTSDGRPAFPNARVVAQEAEWVAALGTNPRLLLPVLV